MLFNSVEFLIFFPIVLFFYFIIPDKFQKMWLLVCSYFFYMAWDSKYVVLIAFITLITFLSGLVLENRIGRKCIFVGIVILCIAILGIFKYGEFVVDNINIVLRNSQSDMEIPTYSFVLPVGISFYTFTSLGYIIDIYRKKSPAEKNIVNYALFISFFPIVVSGPIERSDNLLKQFGNKQQFDWNRVKCGLMWMLYGFFMKIVIADRAAVVVNTVYSNHSQYSGSVCLIASLLFTFQIYCDFSGYTNIARGAALVLGFDLISNFKQPYLACSIKDFWSRWHLSLSTWFRDYLYIPLGGNRKGKFRASINKMITFLVSGLWHGADWHFVIWGGLHGIYQVVEDVLLKNREKHSNKCKKIVSIIFTFCLVSFAWIFFRADSVLDAISITNKIIFSFEYSNLFDGTLWKLGWGRLQMVGLFGGCFIIMLVDIIREYCSNIHCKVQTINPVVKKIIIYFMIIYILIVMVQSYGQNSSAFIYAQF